MTTTLYDIYAWFAEGPPHPKANAGPAPLPGEKHAQMYTIELTPEEVLGLSVDNDVMILGAGPLPGGSRKHPRIRERPMIMLDTKGGRFRQR